MPVAALDGSATAIETEFNRRLGLFDSTMIVIGGMIGSGIFLVSPEVARNVGSPGWLLVAWAITAFMTVTAALSYGELAAMMPRAGGQYVYLRESLSPLWAFLYGWTLFLVIQTGTIAAVAMGFARYVGLLLPWVGEDRYVVSPIHFTNTYAVSLSTAQMVAISMIALLTWANTRGLQYGRIIQNIFTTTKTGALAAVILLSFAFGWNATVVQSNFGDLWTTRTVAPITPGLTAATGYGLFIAICVSQTGSLFAADAWNNITFASGEVKDPRRNVPLSMALGAIMVVFLYWLCNVAYLVTLPFDAIQNVPGDRVGAATLDAIFPGTGAVLIAIMITLATLGTNNGIILSGARAYYAMARDGLFFEPAARLNRAKVPAWALVMQGLWASLLALPRTYNAASGTYGSMYGELLNYVIPAVLVFYVLTIVGVFRLRRLRPEIHRPYRALGYPFVPALYLLGAVTLVIVLFVYRPATTWPGFWLVLLGLPVYVWRRRNPAA